MYCWDEAKNDSNIDKHGIGFAAAALLFEGPVTDVEDTRFPYGETRLNAYGTTDGRLFVCCYAPRHGWKHIISFRKANAREVKRYG